LAAVAGGSDQSHSDVTLTDDKSLMFGHLGAKYGGCQQTNGCGQGGA